MKLISFAAGAAVSAGLSGLTFGVGVAGAHPAAAFHLVLTSPAPTGIGWNWEWDDDDDDWSQTATWQCPAGCSITWEDDY
jgi:hypothetical protein